MAVEKGVRQWLCVGIALERAGGARIYGRCDLRRQSTAHSVHHCGRRVLCCTSRELPMQTRASRFGSIKISLRYHVRTDSLGMGELLG